MLIIHRDLSCSIVFDSALEIKLILLRHWSCYGQFKPLIPYRKTAVTTKDLKYREVDCSRYKEDCKDHWELKIQ